MDARLALRAVDIATDVHCPQAQQDCLEGFMEGLVPGPAEQLRAAAMDPAAARRFLAGRAALRRFAGDVLGLPASQLQPSYSCPQCGSGPGLSHGRPGFLHRGRPAPLLLSMARTGNWVLLAAVSPPGRGERLGVDAEDPGRFGFEGFDAVALTPSERLTLAGLHGGALLRERARLWSRKEAWLKMTGDGLRVDPRTVAALEEPGVRDLPSTATGLPASLVAAVALG
ncbi:4'-phosphopantetheinyl transferase superfamily protein [Pseudarthrobacter sp. L1SW]|jgi:4'-phosphopantetheinyl transferase|uniref:4'-phosphopantetheinyl transferase family protein n=1 Tax=Pseudarthrobacter sp. L1SW TaxID=2851598 RepID=UPI001E4B2F0E|nr:4'-phosphopantetheinyl transferase superfamily protein [Pseudarthrobacter sp. L1SW]UEL29870.1 4'-phosphopantetheinyl transferase superfamily protein [Pseudarthrobacter sp. L1SW]